MPNWRHRSVIDCSSRSYSKTKRSFSSITLLAFEGIRTFYVRHVPGPNPGDYPPPPPGIFGYPQRICRKNALANRTNQVRYSQLLSVRKTLSQKYGLPGQETGTERIT